MSKRPTIIVVWPEGHPEDAKKVYKRRWEWWHRWLFSINYNYAWTRMCVATFWPVDDEHYAMIDADDAEKIARDAEKEIHEMARLRLKHAVNRSDMK